MMPARIVDDDHYLSMDDLVRYSGLSMRTVQRHLKHLTRPIPHARIGGRVLVKKSAFDAWVEAATVARPTPTTGRLEADAAEIVRSIRGNR